MKAAPLPDVSFEHGGDTFTLRLDHLAIAHFERNADMSFMKAMLHVDDFVHGRDLPRISIIGFVLWAALSAHHQDMNLERAMRMGIDGDMLTALAKAFAAAMPESEQSGPLAEAARPPHAKSSNGKRVKGGTGTHKSGRGAKRANVMPTSGTQHRAN